MKRINYILFALLTAVTFSACTSEVDDYFDQTSAERIAENISKTKTVLEGAPNGWIMYYYGNTDYGGYNVYMKFANSRVTIQSEIFGTESASSGYKVEQSSGVVLSFDEYNKVFHFFSDPDPTTYEDDVDEYYDYLPSNIGDKGSGFGGDLEFRVMEVSADSVVLSGKKHGARVVMYPAPADFTWNSYLAQVREADESIFESANYLLHLGAKELTVSQSSQHRVMTVTDENGVQTEMPYVVVPGGMKLYRTTTVDSVAMSAFTVNSGATFPEVSNGDVVLEKYAPPIVDQLINGVWQVSYSNFGSYGQPYWNYVNRQTASSFPLRALYLGTYTWTNSWPTAFGLHLRLGNYYGAIAIKAEKKADDEVTFSYDETEIDNGNGGYFYANLLYYYVCYPLIGLDGDEDAPSRTFKVTTDNIYNPSYITLTDESEPTNVITVDQNYNSDPFNN